MSIRETIRTTLFLRHEKLLNKMFGNRFAQVQKNGKRIGRRQGCPLKLEFNQYHNLTFGEFLKEKVIFRIRGFWWEMRKIKRGMALQISHPLYPTEEFFLKKINAQERCPNWKGSGYRPEYMIIDDIFERETGEILLFGDNYTIQEKKKEVVEDVETGFLIVKAPNSKPKVIITPSHIQNQTYLYHINEKGGLAMVVEHWDI